MGENKVQKDLEELLETFRVLKSKLNELDKNAARNKAYDYQMTNENWLNQLMKSRIKPREKKRLLLTQIGYLRINIFTEYFERAKQWQEKNELDKAVETMNKHAEVARMFISTKNQLGLIKRVKKLLSLQSTEPVEYLQKWQTAYQAWFEQKPREQSIHDPNRTKEFNRIKMAFLELYTFSFSVDNFPPLRNRRSDHLLSN